MPRQTHLSGNVCRRCELFQMLKFVFCSFSETVYFTPRKEFLFHTPCWLVFLLLKPDSLIRLPRRVTPSCGFVADQAELLKMCPFQPSQAGCHSAASLSLPEPSQIPVVTEPIRTFSTTISSTRQASSSSHLPSPRHCHRLGPRLQDQRDTEQQGQCQRSGHCGGLRFPGPADHKSPDRTLEHSACNQTGARRPPGGLPARWVMVSGGQMQ